MDLASADILPLQVLLEAEQAAEMMTGNVVFGDRSASKNEEEVDRRRLNGWQPVGEAMSGSARKVWKNARQLVVVKFVLRVLLSKEIRCLRKDPLYTEERNARH